MLRLAILCLTFSFFISCKPYEVTGESRSNFEPIKISHFYFSDSTQDYFYQTDIKAFDKSFSGKTLIKKTDENTHRIIILSDFGTTLIDFSITKQTIDINYILDDLNKKIIIKTLTEDFKILLQTNLLATQQWNNHNETIYKAETFYYFYRTTDQLLKKIVFVRNAKENVIFEFKKNKKYLSEEIHILHQKIPLTIKMHKILL